MQIRVLLVLSLAGLLAIVALVVVPSQSATSRLEVMSSGGFTAAYRKLSVVFSRKTGTELNTVYGASMGGAPSSIPSRLARGEVADVIILASEGLDLLIGSGKVVADSRTDLGSSQIGMAVRDDSDIPDIRTVEAFTQTLLDAKSVAYSASSSGTYLSTVLFPRLGIGDQMALKSTRVVRERVGTVVARGGASIGFQQVSELLPIEGITYVGPIPNEVQKVTMFSAAVTTHANAPDIAGQMITFLSSPEAAPIITRTGMTPLATAASR